MTQTNHDTLHLYNDLFDRVADILGAEKAGTWFTRANPLLRDVVPIVMIYNGKGHRLERFIAEAEKCNDSA